MRVTTFLLSAAIALAASFDAHAWDAEGHQIIAAIAQQNLQPAAAKEVARILAQEPGATLVSVSTWADEIRNQASAPWHYVNFPPGDCTFDQERDCPDGKCLVEAIRKQSDILQFDTHDEKRLKALKYLVHLVGDIHQPLHAGGSQDKGGNKYQIQAFERGTNLHRWWDYEMLDHIKASQGPQLTDLFANKITVVEPDWVPAAIAEESCRIVNQDGFYPGRLVDVDYIHRYRETLAQRLQAAGLRLAALINRVLQP